MPTINNAPTYISTPPAPQPPPGLFNVAMGPLPFPRAEAMGGGIIYVPDTCEDDIFLYAMNCPPVSGAKTFSLNDTPISGAPFTVVTSYTCGAVGYTMEEIEQKVRIRMSLREQRAVERRVWQGEPAGGIGGIPGLFQSATSLGAASCVTEAVEMLEQALADNGIIGGMLHARPGMAAHLGNAYLLERVSPVRVNTMLGTPVVFGQGYNGTGPAGQLVTGDTEYMYASGRIFIWGSDTFVPPLRETFNRTTNQVYAIAEKIFLTVVECGSWAVEVTRTCATTGV